ncbi:hypothetical protein HZF08_02620 [Paenibacillus sp. CGMCC 1.16610]|nr:hypothetical protein [Paenibacillus sp. CGMCC 1.16610]
MLPFLQWLLYWHLARTYVRTIPIEKNDEDESMMQPIGKLAQMLQYKKQMLTIE